MKFEKRIVEEHVRLSNDPVATQVSSSGKPRNFGIDIRNMYRSLFPNIPTPVYTDFMSSSNKSIDTQKFIDLLGDDWELISKTRTYISDDKRYKESSFIFAKDPGYLIFLAVSYKNEKTKSKERSEKTIEVLVGSYYESFYVEGLVGTSTSITLYHPNYWDKNYNEKEAEKIAENFNKCIIPNSEGASIGIISSDQGEYYVKNFSLEGKTPEFLFPDLHYGDGFENFHSKLTERIDNTTKGLILLHGEPGTGKTQYIRVLLKELAKMNKAVLYAPPSLSASLTDPEMMEFISNWVIDNEKDCILLIEDAEPLLEARNGADGRTTGISNLLNMTDGLLNDILGLMVIATFNTELSKIDSALLRPQRLLARKEFKKMPEGRSAKLAEALNIEKPDINYPASLAEFYAAKQNHEVIIHDVDEEKRKIGFR